MVSTRSPRWTPSTIRRHRCPPQTTILSGLPMLSALPGRTWLPRSASAQHANRRRREVAFNVGDQVLLSTKDTPSDSGPRKLTHRFVGSFPIAAVIHPSISHYRPRSPAITTAVHPLETSIADTFAPQDYPLAMDGPFNGVLVRYGDRFGGTHLNRLNRIDECGLHAVPITRSDSALLECRRLGTFEDHELIIKTNRPS